MKFLFFSFLLASFAYGSELDALQELEEYAFPTTALCLQHHIPASLIAKQVVLSDSPLSMIEFSQLASMCHTFQCFTELVHLFTSLSFTMESFIESFALMDDFCGKQVSAALFASQNEQVVSFHINNAFQMGNLSFFQALAGNFYDLLDDSNFRFFFDHLFLHCDLIEVPVKLNALLALFLQAPAFIQPFHHEIMLACLKYSCEQLESILLQHLSLFDPSMLACILKKYSFSAALWKLVIAYNLFENNILIVFIDSVYRDLRCSAICDELFDVFYEKGNLIQYSLNGLRWMLLHKYSLVRMELLKSLLFHNHFSREQIDALFYYLICDVISCRAERRKLFLFWHSIPSNYSCLNEIKSLLAIRSAQKYHIGRGLKLVEIRLLIALDEIWLSQIDPPFSDYSGMLIVFMKVLDYISDSLNLNLMIRKSAEIWDSVGFTAEHLMFFNVLMEKSKSMGMLPMFWERISLIKKFRILPSIPFNQFPDYFFKEHMKLFPSSTALMIVVQGGGDKVIEFIQRHKNRSFLLSKECCLELVSKLDVDQLRRVSSLIPCFTDCFMKALEQQSASKRIASLAISFLPLCEFNMIFNIEKIRLHRSFIYRALLAQLKNEIFNTLKLNTIALCVFGCTLFDKRSPSFLYSLLRRLLKNPKFVERKKRVLQAYLMIFMVDFEENEKLLQVLQTIESHLIPDDDLSALIVSEFVSRFYARIQDFKRLSEFKLFCDRINRLAKPFIKKRFFDASNYVNLNFVAFPLIDFFVSHSFPSSYDKLLSCCLQNRKYSWMLDALQSLPFTAFCEASQKCMRVLEFVLLFLADSKAILLALNRFAFKSKVFLSSLLYFAIKTGAANIYSIVLDKLEGVFPSSLLYLSFAGLINVPVKSPFYLQSTFMDEIKAPSFKVYDLVENPIEILVKSSRLVEFDLFSLVIQKVSKECLNHIKVLESICRKSVYTKKLDYGMHLVSIIPEICSVSFSPFVRVFCSAESLIIPANLDSSPVFILAQQNHDCIRNYLQNRMGDSLLLQNHHPSASFENKLNHFYHVLDKMKSHGMNQLLAIDNSSPKSLVESTLLSLRSASWYDFVFMEFQVSLVNFEGIPRDHDGITRDWLSQTTLCLMNALFHSVPSGFFIPLIDAANSSLMELFGLLCAIAIITKNTIECPLSPFIFRFLAGHAIDHSDIEEIDTLAYRYLNDKELANYNLSYEFTIHNHKLPLSTEYSDVDASNADRFSSECLERIVEIYTALLVPFKDGFYRLIPRSMFSSFKPEEIDRMLNGEAVVSLDQLKKATRYDGKYHLEHPIISLFWSALEEFSVDDIKQLLLFVTGSKAFPLIQEENHLFLISSENANKNNGLPSASTWYIFILIYSFKTLWLPEYSDKNTLKSKLLYAIYHGIVLSEF